MSTEFQTVQSIAAQEKGGFTVERDEDDAWTVSAPGVIFLSLETPKAPILVPLNSSDFDDRQAMMRHWRSLPASVRYSIGENEYFVLNPDASGEWERWGRAADRLARAVLDCPEMRTAFEEWKQGMAPEEVGYANHVAFADELRPYEAFYVKASLGRDGYRTSRVYSVRWDGPFPEIAVDGFAIRASETHQLNTFWIFFPVEGAPRLDERTLRLGLIKAEHPGLTVSFDPEPRAPEPVRWAIPGLVEQGGLTLTYARENFGKTALVMAELWKASRRGECNALYLAFEGANGLDARVAAVRSRFGDTQTFAATAEGWDLGSDEGWSSTTAFVHEMRELYAMTNDGPIIVAIDTMGASIQTGSRILGGAERFLAGVHALRRETGVAVWVIGHGNTEGDVYGFKGLTFDADIVTQVTRRSNGRDRVHTRKKGRHAPAPEQIRTFRIEVVDGAPVAVTADAVNAVAEPEEAPDVPKALRTVVVHLEDAGLVDGLTEDEMRDALTDYHAKHLSGGKDAARTWRHRTKAQLIDAGIVVERDGLYVLAT